MPSLESKVAKVMTGIGTAGDLANEENNAGYVHRELIENLPYYQVVDDCLKGELVIKWRRERYLPRASRSDRSPEANDRYNTILADAVYYNVVAAHTEFMTGQVFMRPPGIELPDQLEPIRENVDGTGLSIEQLARQLVWDLVAFSRFGLFVDYPAREGGTTAWEVENGEVYPLITAYRPWQIANWRTEIRHGKEILVLVVLQELGSTTQDGFDHIDYSRVRVLELKDDIYQVSVYQSDQLSELSKFGRPDYNYFDSRVGSLQNNNRYYTDYLSSYPANFLADFRTKARYTLVDRFTPTNSNGETFGYIPFSFGGARFNTPGVERPTMFDIASVNLGLYRDSSLNQQMLRYTGSGTPWFSGLNKQWIRQVMGGKLALGSTAAIKLPTGGSAGMLQGVANSSIREAMQDKWNYMAALGARVLTGSQAKQKSATEFSLETSEFNSGLALIARNVGKALTKALEFAGDFVGVAETEEPRVDLLTDYGMDRLSPQQRHQLMAEVQGGMLSWNEARDKLSEAGIATLDAEEARRQIEEEGIPRPKKEMSEMQKQIANNMGNGEESEEEDEESEDPNAFKDKEDKLDDQAEADDGFRKDGEEAGPQPKK